MNIFKRWKWRRVRKKGLQLWWYDSLVDDINALQDEVVDELVAVHHGRTVWYSGLQGPEVMEEVRNMDTSLSCLITDDVFINPLLDFKIKEYYV